MAGTARIVGGASIEKALLNAFEQWVKEDVDEDYMTEQFFENKWPYPGPPTQRKSGTIAGNPRDIVDTAALYESGKNSFRYQEGPNGASADWHWDAKNSSGEEYAWYVHEGQGPYARVARPWTDELAAPNLFDQSTIKQQLVSRIDSSLNTR